jgi:hypothetical protein
MSHVESSTPVATSLRERIVRYNGLMVEIGILISVWYWFIGRWWYDTIIPGGLEYSRSMHSFYFWQMWQQCGECAYWSPLNGGSPALQDAYGSFLHPLSMLTSLQFDAMTGSALTVELAFLLMALASWWFAYQLNVHSIVRVWFGLASMMGGHMTSRLELGNIGLALSLASAWLTVVSIWWFVARPNLLRAIVVAMTLAGTLLAGQGYVQLILVSLLPLLGWYAWQQQVFAMPRRQLVVYGGVIATLVITITAPLWVHVIQPNQLYIKEVAEDNRFYQPITRLFANLILDDYDLAKSDIYNNFAYPWAYSTFIGVSSVIFALSGLYWIRAVAHRVVYGVFAAIAVWSAVIASGGLTWLVQYIPNEWVQIQIAGLRYLVVANGYLALSLLVMAMLALHAVLTESHWWPAVMQRIRTPMIGQLGVTVGVVLLLVVNLQQLYAFNKSWVDDVNGYDPQHQRFVDVLNTEPHGLVQAPNWLLMPLLANNYKMTGVVIPWQKPVNILPEPQYMVEMEQPVNSELIAVHDENWSIYRNLAPTAAYAVVFHADGATTPCRAHATAGDVDVECTLDQPGELRVAEFMLPGWLAMRNNIAVALNHDAVGNDDNLNFIRLPVDAGESTIALRYRPWYATLSMYAYVGGWSLALVMMVFLLFFKKTPTAP